MDDGSGKCLLDVISDPSALSEFLRSNSQLLLDGEDLSSAKTQTVQSVSFTGQKPNSFSVSNTSGASSSVVDIPTCLAGTESSKQTVNLGQVTTNDKLSTATIINSNTQSPFRNNTKAAVMSNASRTFSHIAKPTGNLTSANIPVTNMTLASGSKGLTSVGGTFQSKKPIPIQPKNQVIRPNTSLPTGLNIHGNVRHGLATPTTPSLIANQLQMAQPTVLPRGHAPVSVNGADKSRIPQLQTLQANRTVQGSTQSILTTPPKRIAPKQVLSPPLNPALTIASPIRLQQTNIINKQNVQLPAHLLQAQAVQASSQTQPQLYPQQLTNIVRQVTPNIPCTSVQSTPAKPIQQIQQLVHEKLGAQPTQPQSNPIQQKVFTQAQLQAALKQSQLLAQSSPGQQQNLLVQQQILKQLIHQTQMPQQQKQSDKAQPNVQLNMATTPQGVVQLQQQQMAQSASLTVPSSNVTRQVTMANQIAASNQQIQMVLPNQQVVAGTPNTTNLSQQNLNQTLNINNKHQIQVGRSQANTATTQHMIIVSQGNFAVQQSGQPKTTGISTAAGSAVGIQLQNLMNQQRQHQQQQQQVKVVSNVQQVNQTKQVNQQNSTVFLQNRVGTQSQTLKTQTGVNQQPATQQSIILQSKQPLTSTQSTSMIQQLTPAQVQQLQNLGAVQKVFIIKQPEILQKLGMQGAKQTQTIQITQQQLQALQQMQNQQQSSTQQKIIIQNNIPGVGKTTTTVLSAQQVKQLHSLQQQSGSGKLVQSPQTLIQRQALAQQLQKQLSQQQTPKTQTKMAHVPRILQTTGRQPIVTSQLSSKTITTIKQEPNRGVKRSHPETPEPPKVVTRLKSALYQDQQGVSHPDIHTPFKSKIDAFNKLRRYHVYHDPGPTPKDIEKTEGLCNSVSGQLIKRSEKMIEKYRSLILDESMRTEPSSEMVMLYRLFLADERAALAQDKKQITEDLKALKDIAKVVIPLNTAAVDPSKCMKKPEEIPIMKSEPLLKAFEAPPPPPVVENKESIKKELDILNTSITIDSLEHDTLQCNEDEHSDVEREESEIDKAVFNMESSSSVYFEPVNHLSDSLLTDKSVGSPRTSLDIVNDDADESIGNLPMDDDDDEKEDVTATLALLHSMAEELADNIS